MIRNSITRHLQAVLIIASILAAGLAQAGKEEAESAMSLLLFSANNLHHEEVVYSVEYNGVVNVTFDDGVPEHIVDSFMEKLNKHPDINGANVDSANICIDIKR